jgi:hypothetical protein
LRLSAVTVEPTRDIAHLVVDARIHIVAGALVLPLPGSTSLRLRAVAVRTARDVAHSVVGTHVRVAARAVFAKLARHADQVLLPATVQPAGHRPKLVLDADRGLGHGGVRLVGIDGNGCVVPALNGRVAVIHRAGLHRLHSAGLERARAALRAGIVGAGRGRHAAHPRHHIELAGSAHPYRRGQGEDLTRRMAAPPVRAELFADGYVMSVHSPASRARASP